MRIEIEFEEGKIRKRLSCGVRGLDLSSSSGAVVRNCSSTLNLSLNRVTKPLGVCTFVWLVLGFCGPRVVG